MIFKVSFEVTPQEAICAGWRKLAEMAMNRLFLAARGLVFMQIERYRGGLFLIDRNRYLYVENEGYCKSDMKDGQFFSDEDALKEVFSRDGWTFREINYPDGYLLKVELPGRTGCLKIRLAELSAGYTVYLVEYKDKNEDTITVCVMGEGEEKEINLELERISAEAGGRRFIRRIDYRDIVASGELVLAERLIVEGAEFVEEAKNILRPE